MALATLSVDLVAQLGQLQAGLDKAGRMAEKSAATIEARYAKANAVAAGVGAALAGALSVAGITAFVKATIDGVDRLNDLSDATGASIENLSALEDIAARTGTSFDTVGDAVVKMNKLLADAKPGSEAAKALKAIGLSSEELKRLDPAEALRQIAQALAGYADDGNKARLVQELFGKSAKEVAPFLKDLAEQGKLNATVTTQQAKEAEAFNKQLFQLQKNSQDAARTVVAELVPALNKFFAALNGNKKGGGFFASIGNEVKANLASDQLRVVVADIEELQSYIDKRGSDSFLEQKMKGLRNEAARLSREAMAASDALKGFATVASPLPGRRPANEGGGGLRSRSVGDIFGDADKAAKKTKPTPLGAAPLSEATMAALKALEDTDVAKIRDLNATLDELFAMRASGVGGGPELDEAINKVRDALEKFSPAAIKAGEDKKRLDAILAQTPGGVLTDVLIDIELINAAFQKGQIDADKWAQAVVVATNKLRKDTEEPLAEISEFAQQAARNIQDALGQSVFEGLQGDFSNIEDLWKNTIKRMVAQAAAAQLNTYLFGNDFAKTGKVGGAISDLLKYFGSFGGGGGGSNLNYAGQFDGFRAMGGPITAGRAYMVGERGPEIVVPRSNGTVIPNGAAMGGSQFIVQVQGDASENTIRLLQSAFAQFEARMMSRSR